MESQAASSSASTNPTADQTTPIRPDPLVFAVGGGFSRRKPDVIESVSGWAQTRPGPSSDLSQYQMHTLDTKWKSKYLNSFCAADYQIPNCTEV